jgi:hypothetical protein
VLALALFAAVAGPLFVLAIAGLTTSWVDRSFWIAAPSPLYVFAMIETLQNPVPKPTVMLAGGAAMAGWAALGVLLGAIGHRRLERQQTAAQEAWQTLEARLRAEDEAASARTLPP